MLSESSRQGILDRRTPGRARASMYREGVPGPVAMLSSNPNACGWPAKRVGLHGFRQHGQKSGSGGGSQSHFYYCFNLL